ncbi:hypothetical protein ES705_50179 [subsurface metagenome]
MEKYPSIIFLVILLLATLGDLLIPVIIGIEYPGYNHLIDTISTLGTDKSPVQKFQCINLIAVGILFIIFSIGQGLSFTQIKCCHTLFIIGIVLFGVGTILAGIFPEDPKDIAETISGKIHGIASGIGFIFLILNPLWAIWIAEFKDLRHVNITLFILAILTFILFMISENINSGILKYTGLFQRLNLIILYGHLIINYIWIIR